MRKEARNILLAGGFVRLTEALHPRPAGEYLFSGTADRPVTAILDRGFDPALVKTSLSRAPALVMVFEPSGGDAPPSPESFRSRGCTDVTIHNVHDAQVSSDLAVEERVFSAATSLSRELVRRYGDLLRGMAPDFPPVLITRELESIAEDTIVNRLRILDLCIDSCEDNREGVLLLGAGSTGLVWPIVAWAATQRTAEDVYISASGLPKGGIDEFASRLQTLGGSKHGNGNESPDPGFDPAAVQRVVHACTEDLAGVLAPLQPDAVLIVGAIFNQSYETAVTRIVKSILQWGDANVIALCDTPAQFNAFHARIADIGGRLRGHAGVAGLHKAKGTLGKTGKESVSAGNDARTRVERWLTALFGKTPAIYRGVDVSLALIPALREIFAVRIPLALAYAALMRRICAESRPSAVLACPGRIWQARIAVAEARRAGVPTMDVQALMISRSPRYKAPLAELVTVLDSYQKKIYEDYFGVDPSCIHAVGYPGMDGTDLCNRTVSRAAVLVSLGLPPDIRHVVLYAAQPENMEQGEATLAAIVRTCERIRQCVLIVKLHPRERKSSLERYRILVQKTGLGSRTAVIKEFNIYDLIACADLVLTKFSNAGMEAAIMGKPVVAVNLFREPRVIDLQEIGVAVAAENPQDLEFHVSALLTDPQAQAAFRTRQEEYFMRNPHLRASPAAETISRMLANLCSRAHA